MLLQGMEDQVGRPLGEGGCRVRRPCLFLADVFYYFNCGDRFIPEAEVYPKRAWSLTTAARILGKPGRMVFFPAIFSAEIIKP